MDDFCAPQWIDFASSPQPLSDDYFEMEHTVHEPRIHTSLTKCNNSTSDVLDNVENMSDIVTSFKSEMEMGKGITINIISATPHSNKKQQVMGMTYNDVLQQAMQNLQLCAKPAVKQEGKTPNKLNASYQHNSSAVFKTPIIPKQRITRSVDVHRIVNNNVLPVSSTPAETSMKEKDMQQLGSIILDNLNITGINNASNIRNASKNKIQRGLFKRGSHSFNAKRPILQKSHAKVLTCQYRRNSLNKFSRRSNPGPLINMKRAQLKLTIPNSPKLKTQQRIRPVKVPTLEEREKMELEEMKKHQIKAQPISMNVLKGPSTMKKVPKKLSTVPKPFHLTQSKKVIQPDSITLSPPKTLHSSYHKNSVYTIVNNGNTIAVKNENVQHEGVPYIHSRKPGMSPTPFSFEARNKEFQMKKEKKLKNLQMQEVNKIKAEFHARPAPNFSKPSVQIKENNIKKSAAILKPFSFDERNRNLLKIKEQSLKQISEENKKSHQFHANPVPVFKPVTVCSLSKEKVTAKKKLVDGENKSMQQIKRCVNQENEQPNIISNTENNPTLKAKPEKNEEVKESTVISEQPKKQSSSLKRGSTLKDNKVKPLPFELYTDKRARERRQFDEKLKRKEEEEEQRRQQEESERLKKEKIEKMKLRKLAEIKATPLPVYKPLVISKSTKGLTVPQSPAWGNKAKANSVS